MYRTLVRDFQQLRACGVIEGPHKLDDALDAIDAAFPGFALAAIVGGTGLRNLVTKSPTSTPATTKPATRTPNLNRMLASLL